MVRSLWKIPELRTWRVRIQPHNHAKIWKRVFQAEEVATAKPWGSDINEVFFNDEARVWWEGEWYEIRSEIEAGTRSRGTLWNMVMSMDHFFLSAMGSKWRVFNKPVVVWSDLYFFKLYFKIISNLKRGIRLAQRIPLFNWFPFTLQRMGFGGQDHCFLGLFQVSWCPMWTTLLEDNVHDALGVVQKGLPKWGSRNIPLRTTARSSS